MSDALERRLGLFDTTAVVIGAIIGVGIFFTPAEVARLAGSSERALLVWALGGVVALLGALTFAELGRRFPQAGGQYEVLRRAWGPTTAFVHTFCVQTAVLPGSAALIALITAFNLSLAVHGVPPDWNTGTPVAAALVAGVVVVVAVYLLAAWAYFDLLGFDGVVQSKALAAEAVDRVYPGIGGRVVAAAVAISAFGVLNVQFLTGPRLTYAVAADGRFFRAFARVHPRTGTPIAAIALLTVLSLAALAVGTEAMGDLTAWIVVLDALFFGLTGWALLRLGATGPRWWLCAGGFAALEWACVVYSAFDPKVQASALAGALWIGAALIASRVMRARA